MKIRLSQLRKIIREEVTRTLKEDSQSSVLESGPVEVVAQLDMMKGYRDAPTEAVPFKGYFELYSAPEGDVVGEVYFDGDENPTLSGDSNYVTQNDIDSGKIRQQRTFGMARMMAKKPSFNLN